MAGQKILVIDDDDDILDILDFIFKDAGYEVVASATAAVIKDIKIIQPQLVLLDVRISGSEKSGADICQEIKNTELGRELPVILISAENDISFIASECGADSYISKPFDINDILLKVKKLLH